MKETLDDQGFLLLPGLVSEAAVDDLYDTFVCLMAKYANRDYQWLRDNKEGFDGQQLTDEVTAFRAEQYAKFRHFYQAIKLSHSYQCLHNSEKMMAKIADSLGVRPSALASGNSQFRMDMPSDNLARLRWHQDSAYYLQNSSGGNSIVCGLSLHDTPINSGSVELCYGSHKSGKIKEKVVNSEMTEAGTFKSGQKFIDESQLTNFKKGAHHLRKGDVSFYHMNMVHRSGINSTSKIRFSALIRFHNILADDFNAGYFEYVFLDQQGNGIPN